MFKILKYSFFDLFRSRWSLFYALFFLLFTGTLMVFSDDFSKVIISLMQAILILCPLIATMFGVMYYYNSREFTELLLAQPVKRTSIFWGQYLGLGLSLTASLIIGIGLPFVLYGIFQSSEIWNFLILLADGIILSLIFSALGFWTAMKCENRIKGFGAAMMLWLFFAVIYDGIFLFALSIFKDYPLENFALATALLNPIDLGRILVLLKLDISALMGFTGAVFNRFFGSGLGILISAAVLVFWLTLPIYSIGYTAKSKDF